MVNGCDAIRALLAGMVYDDLPVAERARVEAHLAACAACRGTLESMRGAASALDAWVLPPAVARPARRRYAVRRGPRLPVLAWAAAAAVFILALILHLGLRPREAPPSVAPVARPAVPRPPSAEELAAHCLTLLADYKKPRRLHLVDALPLTPVGKVSRAALRERAKAGL